MSARATNHVSGTGNDYRRKSSRARRVSGARRVPGARSPWRLTCAPLGLDIARGVADSGGCPRRGRVQTEFRSRSGFRMRALYTSAQMLERAAKAPFCATFRHVFDDCLGWIHSLQVQWASSNGNNARRSLLTANAGGACRTNCDDRSMVLYSMFFRPFWTPRGGALETQGVASETEGVAIGLCCGVSGRIFGMKWPRVWAGTGVGRVSATVRVSFHRLGRGIIGGYLWRYRLWLSAFPYGVKAFRPASRRRSNERAK